MATQQRRPGPLLEVCDQCGVRFELDGPLRYGGSIRHYCDACRRIRNAARMRGNRIPEELTGQSALDIG